MKTKSTWIITGLLLSACRTDPSGPTVTLTPLSPTTVDDLMAAVDCSDCKIRWFKDNELQSDIEGLTVSADQTTKGETWSILVTEVADDGTEGLPGEAEAMIVNSPPDLSGLTLSATEVYTEDVLAVSLEASDADGDEFTVSYSWLVDDVDAGVDADTLDGLEHFDKGQTVSVTVTATDGEGDSQVSSEVVTVLNSPPTAPEVELNEPGFEICDNLELSGAFLQIPTTSDIWELRTNLTLETWIAPQFGANRRMIFSNDGCCGGMSGILETDGRLTFELVEENGLEESLTTADKLPSGIWSHVAFVFDGTAGTVQLTINGKAAATQSTSISSTPSSSSSPKIGASTRYSCSDCYFSGGLSDFRVWADARSESDIAAGMMESELSDSAGLILRYRLDDGGGSTVPDESGSGLDGSLDPTSGGHSWSSGCDWALGLGYLVCEITTESEDLDDDEITYAFKWKVDGSDFENAETTDHEGDTVPEDVLQEEETWTCTVTPNDGEEDGAEASASLTTLSAVPVWEEETPVTGPPGVYAGAMAYDPISGLVLHFGGQADDFPTETSSETWVWDGEEWTQLFPDHSPPARGAAGIAYDDSLEGLVLFGGIQYDGSYEGQRYADTWFWDGNDWTEMSSTGGPSKRISELVENPGGGVFLYGGNGCKDQKCVYSDSFVFKDGVWSEVFPSASPGALSGHYLAYDEADGLVQLYSPVLANSVWNWNGTSWSEVMHQGGPSVDSVRLVYDSRRDQTMLFSGFANGQYRTDTWAWDGASWFILNLQESPAARNGYAWAYDYFTEEVVLFAGQSTATSSSDPYNFHSDTWTLK